MKTTWFIIFVSLTTLRCFAQSQDTIRYGNYFARKALIDNPYELKLQVGSWIPLGNLAKRMDKRLSLGIWCETIEEKGIKLDIGFNFYFPLRTQTEFDYYLPDTTLKIRSHVIGVMALQARKPIAIYKKIVLEGIVGMGGHCIFTTFELPNNYQKSSEDEDGNIKTILFFSGVNIRHDRTGILLLYNFTPHGTETNHVEHNFGNQSLSITTFYKF